MNNILEVSSITKYFTQGDNEISILENANLTIRKGEFLTLLGESGCGKTTLLQLLGLLDTPNKGEIKISNNIVNNLSDKKRTAARLNYLGFIYQSHNLMNEFTAIENVAIPLFLQGKETKSSYAAAEEILVELGLKERLNHKPSSLSGGEQQRVAIARAMIHNPQLILADEPTGNLDPDNAEKVFSIFFDAVKKRGISVLVVTHNHNLTSYSDRIITINNKKIENFGKKKAG